MHMALNFFPFCLLGESHQQVHLIQEECILIGSLTAVFPGFWRPSMQQSLSATLPSSDPWILIWPTELSLGEATWSLNAQSQAFLTLRNEYNSDHRSTIF